MDVPNEPRHPAPHPAADAGVGDDGVMSIDAIGALITAHDDFPSPGVCFRDIFPILRDFRATRSLVAHMTAWIRANVPVPADVVVGLDSRGFLFGPLIAQELQAAFAPVRKRGKLPGSVARFAYRKEYGEDVFEMQQDAVRPGQNVVVFDDLIATGGSASAAVGLVQGSGAVVRAVVFIVELVDLHGVQALPAGVPTHAVYRF